MKKNFAAAAQLMVLAFGVSGCVQQDEDFTPRRQVGFRPPPVPLNQETLPPVDPQVSPAPTPPSPLPDPAASASNPDPSLAKQNQQSKPAGATGENVASNTPAPEAPKPKPAPPQYAKKVPGKPNQIYNPYTGAILDVTGLTPGTEVRDPRTGQTMLVP